MNTWIIRFLSGGLTLALAVPAFAQTPDVQRPAPSQACIQALASKDTDELADIEHQGTSEAIKTACGDAIWKKGPRVEKMKNAMTGKMMKHLMRGRGMKGGQAFLQQ